MPPHSSSRRSVTVTGHSLQLGHLLVVTATLLATPAVVPAQEEPATAQPETLQPVAQGVYAVLQPHEGRFDDSNSLVVVTDRDVVIVDTQADPAAVRRLVAAVREETDKPIRVLVNTHWHTDHTQGNALLRELVGDELEILGHRSLAEDIPQRAVALLEEQIEELRELLPRAEEQLARGLGLSGQELSEQQRAQQREAIDGARLRLADFEAVRFLPPTRTYADHEVLQRTTGDIHLLPSRAHTRGDTIVYLPAAKVLATGDVLDALPFGGHGYPRDWLRTLESLAELDFDVIVPGHGPIYRGRDQLDLVTALLRAIVSQVDSAVARGDDLETTQAGIDLEPLRRRFVDDDVADRAWQEFIPATVERAWLQSRGELDDDPGKDR